ncbi:MAG TPA: glycoside hydrolase family 3 C-terminal domain-containing protein [Candidatus Acidoferrales bacterium]|nr:glycoside hydrolase family 3 C-terminal domain-containing protein [Candidatus Acidoferrales bacterium]
MTLCQDRLLDASFPMEGKAHRLTSPSIFARTCLLLAGLSLFAWVVLSRSVAADDPRDSDLENRVQTLLSSMSLQEKIDLLGGVDGYFTRDLPRLGLPRLKMADGPMGVRNFGPATAMPGGINLAATWDAPLARRVGEQIGRDARAKGVYFLLGPGVNIYRAPMNGRNFEYFGEDPYLASRIAVAYIEGVQSQGVSATVKHFMGNNSEFARHVINDLIDERTMREIYLPAFEAAVKEAHVGAVMDSYNLINGAHATQNSFLNSDVLKKEWGFPGVLMSDWFSTYDGIAAANAGLDLEMPIGLFMSRERLVPAVEDGRVSAATIDDKVRRILRLAIESRWLERDQTDLAIPSYNVQGGQVAREAAREGMVLLKNDHNLLPLDKASIKSIAVMGPGAYPAVPVGGGSAGVRPFSAVSFLEGMANELGASVPVYYDPGVPELSELAQNTAFSTMESGGSPGLLAEYFSNENLQGEPIKHETDLHINFGAGGSGDLGYNPSILPTGSVRWTGYYQPSGEGVYDFFAASTGEAGGYYRVSVDDKVILDNWAEARALVGLAAMPLAAGAHKVVVEHHGRAGFLGTRFRFGIVRQGTYVNARAEKIASAADAVIVAVGFNPESESEGADRTFGLPPGQNELIEKIASLNHHTIVVVTSGGGIDMQDWIDRIPALLETWYPGEQGGNALAEILFGDRNPSGRLPVTFERRWEDNPVHGNYYPAPGTEQVAYQEGVFVGYRGYEHGGSKPLFPFGYGLSYTTFRYQNLSVRSVVSPKGLAYEVSFDVTNTGRREGADVAEVYVGQTQPQVPRPEKELKGFARVNLLAGESRRVQILLDSRAFSYYDTASHQWRVDPGTFTIFVGRSVDQIELQRRVSLTPSQALLGSSH